MLSIKKLVYSAVLTVSALLPVAASAAPGTIEADIPFAFVVKGVTMPAGTYEIAMNETGSVASIRGYGHSVMVGGLPDMSSLKAVKSGLVFTQKKGVAYLSNIHFSEGTFAIPIR